MKFNNTVIKKTPRNNNPTKPNSKMSSKKSLWPFSINIDSPILCSSGTNDPSPEPKKGFSTIDKNILFQRIFLGVSSLPILVIISLTVSKIMLWKINKKNKIEIDKRIIKKSLDICNELALILNINQINKKVSTISAMLAILLLIKVITNIVETIDKNPITKSSLFLGLRVNKNANG